MDLEQICAKALDHFGERNQINKCIEELGELIAALGRYQNEDGMMLNIVEEIADCTIMLAQMSMIFDPDLVDEKIRQKLKRLDSMVTEL